MPEWKIAVPKPGGSVPEGLLNKIAVGLGTVLVLALILSAGFCGGGSGEETDGGSGEETDGAAEENTSIRPGRPVDQDLQAVIARQQQDIEAAQRAADLAAAQQRLLDAREAAANPDDPATAALNMPPDLRAALLDSLGRLPDPDMIEIRRQADLEELARRITSLRANPVALSFRDPASPPPASPQTQSIPPQPPQLDLAGALDGARAFLPQGGTAQPQPGQLDIPPPSSARPNNYDNPPHLITPNDPPGWERVYEGSFLEAVLVNQLEGEFPGPVLATVAVPFYSADRQRVLIPRGARLIGSAQAVRRRDQSALAVGFHRLVFLDGRHVPLRFIGLDQAGSTGLRDQVNRHYFSTFLAAGAVGVLSGLALVGGDPYGGGVQSMLAGAGGGIASTGDDVLDRFLNRLPTITIRAGQRLRVWFTTDVLIPYPPSP